MKRIIQFIVFQCFINIGFAQMPIPNKVALVVGNAQYKMARLKNPENDANAITEFLKKQGFDVILGVNWTRSQMIQALHDFEQKLKSDGVALFYYSGHGIEQNGHNYLCPIETETDKNLAESDKFVDLDEILRRLHSKHSYLNLLFLDACRTEMTKGARIMASLSPSFNGETIISFAAAPGQPAFDGSGNISPYTESVLSALNKPCTKVADYFSIIVDSVKFKTANAQIPWVNNSLTSIAAEFSFVGCNRSDQALRLGIEKYEKKEICEGFNYLNPQETTFATYAPQDLIDKTAFWLGYTYETDQCAPKNVQKAMKYYEMAARRNHLEAQYRLGCVYKTLQNCEQARSWFSIAAQSGHAAAQFELGFMHEQGKCLPRNNLKAAEWYEKAAKQNYLEASYRLGVLYDNGVSKKNRGVVLVEGTESEIRERNASVLEQNIQKAVEYYRKAAEGGHKLAQFTMGTIYENGEPAAFISINATTAFEWYQKAALQKEPCAQNALGNLYFDGRGTQKNDNQAFIHYVNSANQGNKEAQNHVGQLYFEGKGVPQNDKLAFEWFLKAAEQNLVEAQYNIGVLYLAGRGVLQNGKLAFEWIQKAALQGHVNAEYYLGMLYFEGTGVIQNDDSANNYLQKAAEKKFDLAQFYLAKLHQKKGRNTEAFRSFKQVFESQQVIDYKPVISEKIRLEAQYELALMYRDGRGTRQDVAQAANWLRDAADAHYAKAETALGALYEQGIGVPRRDLEKACDFYKRAAKQKEPVALEKMKKIPCGQ